MGKQGLYLNKQILYLTPRQLERSLQKMTILFAFELKPFIINTLSLCKSRMYFSSKED